MMDQYEEARTNYSSGFDESDESFDETFICHNCTAEFGDDYKRCVDGEDYCFDCGLVEAKIAYAKHIRNELLEAFREVQ